MTDGTLDNGFDFEPTPLAGLMVVQRKPIEDHRGFFSRFFCAVEFREAGFATSIAQINHTFTCSKGAVRGLHFQYPPHAEVKIVSCLKGEIFDVAVDIRKGSPTFLHWHGDNPVCFQPEEPAHTRRICAWLPDTLVRIAN